MAAYAGLRLSGLYAYRHLYPEARARAEGVALAFPGTRHEQAAWLTIALQELDGLGDAAAALEALARVPASSSSSTAAAPSDRAEAAETNAAAAANAADIAAASVDLTTVAAGLATSLQARADDQKAADDEAANAERRRKAKAELEAEQRPKLVPLPAYQPDPFLLRLGRYLFAVGVLLLILLLMLRPMPPEKQQEALQGKPFFGCLGILIIVLILIILPHCRGDDDATDDDDDVTDDDDSTPVSAHAAIAIDKAKIVHHAPAGDAEVDSGHAQDWLSVDFTMAWSDRTRHAAADGHSVTVTWDFGDGTTAVGESVSHAYSTAQAGVRTVRARIECDRGGDVVHASSGNLELHVLTGIEIVQIGDETPPTNHRLSFNDKVAVRGRALPASLPADCDDLIDWHLQIETQFLIQRNDADPKLTLPDAMWPRYNFGWGHTPLYATIDFSSANSGLDQDGELVHGAVGFLSNIPQVTKYYSATTSENATADPNWFFYYKAYEGGSDYAWDGTLATSQTTRATPGSTRIANNAYTGGNYLTHGTNAAGGLSVTGWSGSIRWLRYFMGVVPHERQHANGEQSPAGGATDNDSDWLTNDFETSTSNTDPDDADSARGPGAPAITDDEYYAGGPVEKAGIDGESGDKDWAHPGTNWTTP